jgi:hypothetical protein
MFRRIPFKPTLRAAASPGCGAGVRIGRDQVIAPANGVNEGRFAGTCSYGMRDLAHGAPVSRPRSRDTGSRGVIRTTRRFSERQAVSVAPSAVTPIGATERRKMRVLTHTAKSYRRRC